mmetsp:Transcript_12096/g.26485  ORF Transcript_12096/g.26485 Transcript_12096/m.26485 type:complete len:97 (-) Transcript_12096:71-361(-)
MRLPTTPSFIAQMSHFGTERLFFEAEALPELPPPLLARDMLEVGAKADAISNRRKKFAHTSYGTTLVCATSHVPSIRSQKMHDGSSLSHRLTPPGD